DEDDRAKVQALLNRGLAALAESREDVEVPKHTAARLKRKVQETQYVFVPQRKKAHFLSQSGGVGFDPIDINLVCGES
ncbi:MAG: hypothetical protein KDK78_02075, partial [Chlamydiia bacterium]|nr:hypothetical protein [Chlamydiia bacterium]